VLDVSVTNTNDVPLTVVVEPWARELAVLTIYGWEGSTISDDSPDTD